MATVSATTDQVTPRHEMLMTAGLEMACASVSRYADLDRSARREMLHTWGEFMANLAALGVPAPVDPKGL